MAKEQVADEYAAIAARVAELRREQDAALASVKLPDEPVVPDAAPASEHVVPVASYGAMWGCPDGYGSSDARLMSTVDVAMSGVGLNCWRAILMRRPQPSTTGAR
jgi:hypothetical protein